MSMGLRAVEKQVGLRIGLWEVMAKLQAVWMHKVVRARMADRPRYGSILALYVQRSLSKDP